MSVEKLTASFRVTENIYVAGDGKTVVKPNDPRVAFLKYGVNRVITPAEHAALIFPGGGDPVPDAEQRSAEAVPDAESRGGRKRK